MMSRREPALRGRSAAVPRVVLLVGLLLASGCGGAGTTSAGPDLRRDARDGQALVRATAPALSRGDGVTWLGLHGQVTRCDGNLSVASFSAGGDIREGAPTVTAARAALARAGLEATARDGDLVVRRGRATMTYRVVPVRGGASTLGRYTVATPCTDASEATVRSWEDRGRTDYAAELDLPQ